MESPLCILRTGPKQAESATAAGTRLFRLIRTLEGTSNVSYILDSQYRFIYCNPAWDQFAESNEAPLLLGETVIGHELFASIPSALHDVYAEAFRQVAERGSVWGKSYECSSPTEFRKYRMRIYPLKNWNWFLVTNSLLVERRHNKGENPDDLKYFNEGVVIMCAHCRCSQQVKMPSKWDFVPQYLRFKGVDSIRVSHQLCPVCQHHYYPQYS